MASPAGVDLRLQSLTPQGIGSEAVDIMQLFDVAVPPTSVGIPKGPEARNQADRRPILFKSSSKRGSSLNERYAGSTWR